jgi:pimeloyl-ACP methyl ester carboxylesterase
MIINNEKENIYCISGLGADERIFENLKLADKFELEHLSWMPAKKNETIESYAARMAGRITENQPILMGVSFGGMIAVEISKLIPTKKIIIVSSLKTRYEEPLYFRIGAALHLNKIIPLKPTRFLEPFENYNVGVVSDEDKALAKEYRQHFDYHFSSWAIERIIHWKNETYPSNLIHLHGSADHILPIRYVKPDYIIKGGGHLMILNRANEVSKILNDELIRTYS